MSRYIPLLFALLLPALAAPGCGENASSTFTVAAKVADDAPQAAPHAGDQPAGGQAAKPDSTAISRKIIYNAQLEIVVPDLTITTREVESLVQEKKGYIAQSEISGDTGKRRSAKWVLKIPAEQFRITMAALAALGIPVRNASDSQDVTEEFLDLQARVKNLKAEEEALNKMVREAATLDAILKLRREITELRGNIERAEGRLKFLTIMSALSTITLTAREEVNYVPPTTPEPPTFLSRVQGTFSRSVSSLRDFGESVGLFLVALVPWLPVLLIGVFLLRRSIRSIGTPNRSGSPTVPQATQPETPAPEPESPRPPQPDTN